MWRNINENRETSKKFIIEDQLNNVLKRLVIRNQKIEDPVFKSSLDQLRTQSYCKLIWLRMTSTTYAMKNLRVIFYSAIAIYLYIETYTRQWVANRRGKRFTAVNLLLL